VSQVDGFRNMLKSLYPPQVSILFPGHSEMQLSLGFFISENVVKSLEQTQVFEFVKAEYKYLLRKMQC